MVCTEHTSTTASSLVSVEASVSQANSTMLASSMILAAVGVQALSSDCLSGEGVRHYGQYCTDVISATSYHINTASTVTSTLATGRDRMYSTATISQTSVHQCVMQALTLQQPVDELLHTYCTLKQQQAVSAANG
eukprot:21102-Heterococcus_DN1.PRE.1